MDDLRITTDEYVTSEETLRRSELRWGCWVQEPAAPYFTHQMIVLRVARALCDHVEPSGLGHVAVAPVDVILDREGGLVVQPDVLFVSAAREKIIDRQVWGAPDLVVEVLSDSTEGHDRGEKLTWYRQYGVRECWLVDLDSVSVFDFTGTEPEARIAQGFDPIRSTVLPDFTASVLSLFPR